MRVMKAWVDKPGHPVITVERRGDGVGIEAVQVFT
jgi:hypothetical protein